MTYDNPTPELPTSAPELPSAASEMPSNAPEALPPTRRQRLRFQMEAALLNRRLLTVTLLLLLTGLVTRTLLFARETPSRRALSSLYMDSYDALSATKSAYTPGLIFTDSSAQPGSASSSLLALRNASGEKNHNAAGSGDGSNTSMPGAHVATGSARQPAQIVRSATAPDASSARFTKKTLAQARGEQAAQKWRDAARSKQAQAAEWRRLGIVLALFHRPGVLEALAHVADKFPPLPVSESSPGRASMQTGNSNIDPFGHGRTGVSVAQELAAWQAVYGAQKVTAAQVVSLRNTLLQLRLGWFENIALAHLYQKAGLHADAVRAAEEANHTASSVRAYENTEINIMLFGFVGLFFGGVITLVRFLQSHRSSRDAQAAQAFFSQTQAIPSPAPFNVPSVYAPSPQPQAGGIAAPMYPAYPTGQFQVPAQTGGGQTLPDFVAPSAPLLPQQHSATSRMASGQRNAAQTDSGDVSRLSFLSQWLPASRANVAVALLLAFILYLVGHTGLGLLTRYALRPFSARLDTMTTTQLMRLEWTLQFALYIPVMLLPLLALRARLARYRQAGEALKLGELLAHLGYRTRSLPAEIKTAVFGYILLAPFLLLAGLVSHALFHNFHTPVNPAQFETMAAQQMLDKVLIFALAAVVAPIVEETMFRGLLYSALRARFGIGGAAMLSAAAFSLVHPTLPGGFLTIWAIGIALALVYERRGSLVPGIILHGIHNGLITLLGFAVFGK